MKSGFAAFLLAALIATVMTPMLRALAKRLGVLDRPLEARKIQKVPIPRLGGLAIVLGAAAPCAGLYFYRNDLSYRIYESGSRFVALSLAIVLIVCAGLFDDVKGLSQRYRLAVEAVAGVIVYFGGFRVDAISLPFVGHVAFGPLALPITVLWILAVINALNFMDGLDGLAAGISVISAGVLFVLALYYENFVAGVFSASIAGAAFGFLLFNFHPATVYMGDTGSMFLGLALAVTAIGSSQKNAAVVSILGPLIALGLPIGDMTLRVLRRIILGQRWFPADRKHVHHRLLDLGLPHRSATLVLWGATAMFALAALAVSRASAWQAAGVCAFVVGCIIFAVRKLGFAEFNRFGELRRRQVSEAIEDLTKGVEDHLANVESAHDAEAIWQRTVALCDYLRIDRVKWSPPAATTNRVRLWERDHPRAGDSLIWTPQEREAFSITFALEAGAARWGTLTLSRESTRNLPFNGVERLAARLLAASFTAAMAQTERVLDVQSA